jgi:hypothetical protein
MRTACGRSAESCFLNLLQATGRATYRGEKITKRVWQDILAGDYVAQALVIPGERSIGSTDNPSSLKFDLRVYVYDGKVQWTAARMYQGQTTNFRTLRWFCTCL